MLSRAKRVITVATDAQILNDHYYRRVWLCARNVHIQLPRRKWLDVMADSILLSNACIRYPSGEPYVIPEIDDVFGDDPDMRWLSYYLRADATGENPWSRSRNLERVRLIGLFLKINYPELSQHFER